MYNPRWHWRGDQPRYDKSYNSTLDYLAATSPRVLDTYADPAANGVVSDTGIPELGAEFPDLGLTLTSFDRNA